MFTHVDNRERAKASDWKQRRWISLKEQHENFTGAVRKWEMLVVSKEQWSEEERWVLIFQFQNLHSFSKEPLFVLLKRSSVFLLFLA